MSSTVHILMDTWNFWFSLVGAIGSAATAAAFGFIIHQTRLTQKELDNTLRPRLGVLQTHGKDIEVEAEFINTVNTPTTTITVKYILKNYGRVPARVTSKRYKWSKKEISKKGLYSEEITADWSSSRLQSLLLPEEDARSTANSLEQSFLVSPGETFYFGLLVDYDSGEGTKKEGTGLFSGWKTPPLIV
jgi:hypothetical protein